MINLLFTISSKYELLDFLWIVVCELLIDPFIKHQINHYSTVDDLLGQYGIKNWRQPIIYFQCFIILELMSFSGGMQLIMYQFFYRSILQNSFIFLNQMEPTCILSPNWVSFAIFLFFRFFLYTILRRLVLIFFENLLLIYVVLNQNSFPLIFYFLSKNLIFFILSFCFKVPNQR